MSGFKLLNWSVVAIGMALTALIGVLIDQSATATLKGINSPLGLDFWSVVGQIRDSNTAPQLLAQQRQSRTAVIIANYDYEGDDNLDGPRQDAAAMYEKLKSLGFDVPPPTTNANKQQMEQAIRDFVQRMHAKGPGGANVFYYSGHGIQINGFNYLLPVGLANTSSEIDVEYNAVRLDYVANKMYSVVHDFNFLIIDACRNNPLLRRWNRPKGPGSQGLTFIAPPTGTMIAYAAEPGEVARDGDDNSPFTANLLNYLSLPGITIYEILHRVRNNVREQTNGGQIPVWEGSPNDYRFSFNSEDSFVTAATPQSSSPIQELPLPASSSGPAQELEFELPYDFRSRSTEPTLISATTGVNYQPLRDALIAGNYRLADNTTGNLMLRAVGREQEGWFQDEALSNFPCEDLRLIDQLWLDHSDGKFGFSVQQQIYQSLGGILGQYDKSVAERLSNQVGWRLNIERRFRVNYDFYDAPTGHLPVVPVLGMVFPSNLPSCRAFSF